MNKLIPVLILSVWLTDSLAQNFEIYVSDAGNFNNPPWQILKFDQNGDNPEVFISDNLGWPQDILFLEDENTVLISNLSTNRINRHDADTGDFIDVFASNLNGPTRMKVGPDGLLYVLQWNGSGEVKRYQLDGTFVDEFTSVGVPRSIGLDWDNTGNLYVSSFNQALVRKFNAQGNDMGVFASANLEGPTNIWFGEGGNLFVTDWSGGAIRQYDASGSYVGDYITNLGQAEGVDELPNGNLLIGNGVTDAVKMYDPDGNFLEDLIESGAGGLIQPNAVRVRAIGEPDFAINGGLGGTWFNPETDGQGFVLDVITNVDDPFLVIYWFTYDLASGGPSAQRWLIADGGYQDGDDAVVLTVFQFTGGAFDQSNPPVRETIGMGRITFHDCTNATFSYELDFDGDIEKSVANEFDIVTLSPDVAEKCEALLNSQNE